MLGQWFKNILEVIEGEYQASRQFSGERSRVFPTQKQYEQEILQTDSFLLIQVVHNMAVKEMQRQVSVQCVERGILLKAIFDSYVRLVDLIFQDGFH